MDMFLSRASGLPQHDNVSAWATSRTHSGTGSPSEVWVGASKETAGFHPHLYPLSLGQRKLRYRLWEDFSSFWVLPST